jgi:hypothetical protein
VTAGTTEFFTLFRMQLSRTLGIFMQMLFIRKACAPYEAAANPDRLRPLHTEDT